MSLVRRLLTQRHLAVLICLAVLCMKLIVPAGFMVASDHGRMAISICSGTGPMKMMMGMPVGMAAMDAMAPSPDGHGDHGGKDHGKTEMPCAFSGLSAHALGTIDPILLVALVAFILTMGFNPIAPACPSRRSYLRPPLRGPPAPL